MILKSLSSLRRKKSKEKVYFKVYFKAREKYKEKKEEKKKKSRVLLLFLSEILFQPILVLNTRIALINVKNERISRFLIIFMLFWCLKPKIG